MAMKPLYVVGTQRDIGKTTMSIGLVHALRERGLKVAYAKPLGQRVKKIGGRARHDDALVISRAMHIEAEQTGEAILPLTRGRVEEEIHSGRMSDLAEKIAETCRHRAEGNDILIVESMGHVAAGACVGLSSAEVAQLIGSKVMIVSGGGIGRAIDEIALCASYMHDRGADLMGAVVNKVWPEKYDRVNDATGKGLERIGIHPLGVVPYEPILASPTVEQVAEQLEAEILSGHENMGARIRRTIVAAMEAQNMVQYLRDQTLVITPGDRSDNILAIISAHMLMGDDAPPPVSAVLLTGGFRPNDHICSLLKQSHLPALLCEKDTYALASRLGELVFKITPEDHERIEAAMTLAKYVDVDYILEQLED